MRIKIQQFLFGKNYSWSIVSQNLGRALLKLGHDVEFISTDGIVEKYVPEDLKPHVRKAPTGIYDCQISYTAPHNWPHFLAHGTKNKFGIWNYEYNSRRFDQNQATLLAGFAKYAKTCTKVLPSSNFSKEVFRNMLVPEDLMVVVPHGINLDDFNSEAKMPLKTKKSKKILLNIAQPHRRKALHLALKSFGQAFTKNDDVCLVAKVFKDNKKNHDFDVDFPTIYHNFERKFPNHAEVECVYDYVPNIADIYKACDVNFSATFAECWHLPSLEALAAGIINVVPRYGGQLDFCNDDNSLLIDGSVIRAPRDHQYWSFNPFAVHFEIDTNDAAKKLQQAVSEHSSLVKRFESSMKETVSHFTWNNAAQQILDLCS